MKTLKGTFLGICMILGSVSYAQDFDQYDTDKDGKLNQTEFTERNKAGYSTWDENRDGKLDYVELSDMAYESFDRDKNDFLDENEWNEGINSGVGAAFRNEDYDSFDTNADGQLDVGEWEEANNENTWFDKYDTNQDGLIDNDEWNINTFEDWDVNDDDFIDEDEFDDYDAFNQW